MRPTTNRLIVVSRSARWLIANLSYGRVRKKSNQTPAETDARIPATRLPRIAIPAITATRTSAAAVSANVDRAGARAADTASGSSRPQIFAAGPKRFIGSRFYVRPLPTASKPRAVTSVSSVASRERGTRPGPEGGHHQAAARQEGRRDHPGRPRRSGARRRDRTGRRPVARGPREPPDLDQQADRDHRA